MPTCWGDQLSHWYFSRYVEVRLSAYELALFKWNDEAFRWSGIFQEKSTEPVDTRTCRDFEEGKILSTVSTVRPQERQKTKIQNSAATASRIFNARQKKQEDERWNYPEVTQIHPQTRFRAAETPQRWKCGCGSSRVRMNAKSLTTKNVMLICGNSLEALKRLKIRRNLWNHWI